MQGQEAQAHARAHVQAGDIFPSMSNYKRGHRATSIGTQLLSNYRKYLAAYERAWAAADLPEHPLLPVSACGWLLDRIDHLHVQVASNAMASPQSLAHNGTNSPQSAHACHLRS